MGSKLLSILLLFDDESKEKIINLKKELQIPANAWNNLPHLTLAVYDEEVSEDEIVSWTKKFAKEHTALRLELYAFGVFGQRFIFLVPNFSPKLFKMYEDIHKEYDEYCNNNTSYKIGKWSPHVGIWNSTPEMINEKLKLIHDKLDKFEVNLVSVKVTSFENDKFTTLLEQDLS
jgi:hypothetical protein